MYGEVELNNRNNDQKKEMGEDHTFFWDPAVLTLVEGPQLAEPSRQVLNRGSDGKCTKCNKAEGDHNNHSNGNKNCYGNWIARAPSWAEFKVAKIWGDGHRCLRARSSAHRCLRARDAKTEEDVRMIGDAVSDLKEQRLKQL